jgi:hypothetical protein
VVRLREKRKIIQGGLAALSFSVREKRKIKRWGAGGCLPR